MTLCCPLQVEEHNGHIFRSTQYSIPTYCEYCSSLIWMMDRACVCKCELSGKHTLLTTHYLLNCLTFYSLSVRLLIDTERTNHVTPTTLHEV